MGRYSSVQSYSDNNPNMRAVTHEAATSSSGGGTGQLASLKTEKVYNPYGSTAGAGSGEFHIYRHARMREMERIQKMDDDEMEMNEQQAYEKKVGTWKEEEEDKLNKKRKKRMRNKASKLRKKNMNLSGVINKNATADGASEVVVNEDEFEYTPLHELEKKDDEDNDNDNNTATTKKDKDTNTGATSKKESSDTDEDECGPSPMPMPTKQNNDEKTKSVSPPKAPLPFKNDGSFLEMMKKMQKEE